MRNKLFQFMRLILKFKAIVCKFRKFLVFLFLLAGSIHLFFCILLKFAINYTLVFTPSLLVVWLLDL